MFSGQEGTVLDWLCITNRKPEFKALKGPGGPRSPIKPGSPETQRPQDVEYKTHVVTEHRGNAAAVPHGCSRYCRVRRVAEKTHPCFPLLQSPPAGLGLLDLHLSLVAPQGPLILLVRFPLFYLKHTVMMPNQEQPLIG